MTEEWWQGFFASPLWLDVHSQIRPPEETTAEVDFFARGLAKGARILDVPCGLGRHSLQLAARGFQVTGVDATPALLEKAREGARTRGLSADFQEGDMRAIDFEGAFDLVLNFWGSFGYFDDEANLLFLASAARALAPGGRLIVDTHVMESLMPKFQERIWSWAGDVRVIEERRFDLHTGRLEGEWTLQRGAASATNRTSIRIYTVRELEELLARAGLAPVELLAGVDGKPFKVGSPRLVLVARRNGDRS